MKRKLNAFDECSRGEVTATTAGLTFASQSLSSPEHPAQESRCQVAFCEQTAREMTELVDYWQAVQSAQKERSPVPSAPVGNSLFAWSDDEEDSTISVDSNLQRQLFPEIEEVDDEHYEQIECPPHNSSTKASDSFERKDEESFGAARSPRSHSLRSGISSVSLTSTPTSQDETSSFPSEIYLRCSESPDWLICNAEEKIVQNIHVVSQQQSKQVNQLTRRTAELEQQVHTTLMNSPLFQRFNRRSPFKKQRQEVLQAIDVALDQSGSPTVSSFPRCWQDRCDLWLRYGWYRLEETLHLGLWEWVPLEWLTIYYYLWARPSAQTRWTILLVVGLMSMILLHSFPLRPDTSTSNLVHFPKDCVSASNFPEEHEPALEVWLL